MNPLTIKLEAFMARRWRAARDAARIRVVCCLCDFVKEPGDLLGWVSHGYCDGCATTVKQQFSREGISHGASCRA